jgi:hypothetical protein
MSSTEIIPVVGNKEATHIVDEVQSQSLTEGHAAKKSAWAKFLEIIWDSGDRTAEERRLVQRLDIYVL